MPRYDRKCRDCAWLSYDVWEPAEAPIVPCPDCGAPTERAWLQAASVIGDEIDHVQRNGTKRPIRFRSRLERNRWLKANGYRELDTEESKGARSADCMDPVTMANAAALVARAASAPATWRDPDHAPIGITSDEGVIRYLTDRSRAEFRGEYGFAGR